MIWLYLALIVAIAVYLIGSMIACAMIWLGQRGEDEACIPWPLGFAWPLLAVIWIVSYFGPRGGVF